MTRYLDLSVYATDYSPSIQAVSDQLMEHMGYLSTLRQDDPATEASQTQIITYILPQPFETRNPQRILIEEAPNLLAAGSNVGLRTWEASLHLAQYLHSHQSLVHCRSVVELGAGTGLVSILVAGPLGASHVVATDGLLHVVEAMEKNIHRNERTVLQPDSTIEAKVLDWADNEPDSLEDALSLNNGDLPSYNLILGADITYSPDVVPVLAQLLKVLMVDMFVGSSIEALISATVRNERTLSLFREACVERGLVVQEVEFTCPSVKEQRGLFHEQAFPIVIMKIQAPS